MKKHLTVYSLFIILIMLVTFPLVFKITTCIPGFFSTDESFASLWDYWKLKQFFINKISPSHTDLVCYPFGLDLRPVYSAHLWAMWRQCLSIITTPVLAFNIQILLNIFLSLILVYFFALFLIRSKPAAFLAALVFGFCPYQFARIWQHLGLTYNQWIPLVLFAAILVKDKPLRKYAILFLVGILLIFSFDYSIMYFAVVSLFTFFIYVFFYKWRIKFFKERQILSKDIEYFKKVIIVGSIAFIFLLWQFFPLLKSRLTISLSHPTAFNVYNRPFEDLFSQSAKPLSYLLPASTHPVFGKFTEQFIGSPLYGESFTEHTLYLGWIPIILAFVAIRRWRKNRKIQGQPPAETVSVDNENFYIGFFIFLAIVAWFFSQPPWWKFGPIKIFMPSFFMYKILPMYRAYCRFGIVVMLAVAVLAGFGLKFLLEKFKSQKTKVALTVLCCGLVLFEFWNWPPYKVIDVSKVPAVYYWLKEQPDNIVIAEYPLDYNGSNELHKFYQTKHEKRLINGTTPGTYANKVSRTITKLSDPKTAGVLKWMGVKYVIVHRDDYLQSGLTDEIEELQKISKNPNLKLVKSFPSQECPNSDIMCVQKTGPIDVYLLEAVPVEPAVKDK